MFLNTFKNMNFYVFQLLNIWITIFSMVNFNFKTGQKQINLDIF